MPNVVSQCCGASVEPGIKKEYPLGGRTWYETLLVDICEDCKQECDAVMVCSYCGAEATSESPTFYLDNVERCYGCADREVVA